MSRIGEFFVRVVLVVALLLAITGAGATVIGMSGILESRDTRPLAAVVVASAVQIERPDGGIGSGVVVRRPYGTGILTAGHVVQGVEKVKVSTDRLALVAWVARVSETSDLAWLVPETTEGLSTIEIEWDVRPVVGEDTWYCGSGGRLARNLQRGIVNQEYQGLLWVNGGGWYGHSGSGVFVKRPQGYRLVGIATVLHDTRNPKSPIGCEPLDAIRRFLEP